MRIWRVLSITGILLGLVGAAWASRRLSNGLIEIPGHWWSSLAVAPGVAGLLLAAVAWHPSSRRHLR